MRKLLKRTREEKIIITCTEDTAFNIVGKLYELGIKGVKRI